MLRCVFFIIISFSFVCSAQNIAPKNERTYNLQLNVSTTKRLPDAGRDVVFIESETYERVAYKTDVNGELTATFDHGTLWLGSVGEMRNCIELNVSWGGNMKRKMTYDPVAWSRSNEARPDRRSIKFKIVDQYRISPMVEPSSSESVFNLQLSDRNRKGYGKIEVSLVCFETKTKYRGRTNSNGGVTFKVPINNKYDIDVDGVESLNYYDFGSRPKIINYQLLYQPRMFKEVKGDRFIVQDIPTNIEPSSSHARIKLKVRKNGLKDVNEDVYVRMLKSNNVYKAKTNEIGEVIFMLPIRKKYVVDFQFQRNADVIDLSKVRGIAFKEKSVEYLIDPRLSNIENFIPAVKDLIEYDIHSFVKKQYPEPTDGDVDFYLKWGNKFNKKSKEAMLEIGLKVKSKMTRRTSEPLNICFVIDKSGSMIGENRIGQLKLSLIEFVQQMDAKDMVSIVVFDNEAVLAVPSTLVGDKKKVIDVIFAIGAGGGTNIYEGMVKGFEELKKHSSKTTINRLLLLTDGYGSTPPEEIIAAAKSFVSDGFELSAIGVGVQYNQALLSQLSSAGGGLLHLAGSSSHLQEVFRRELQSIFYPMAKKAKLTVKYNDAIVYRQLYGYSNEVVANGQMKVEIPNLFPGMEQLALMKLDLIHPKPSIVTEPVVVTLEYNDAITGKLITIKKKIHPQWSDATGELDMTLDIEHKKVLAIAIANQSLKAMANAFENGSQAQAVLALESAQEQIKNIFPEATPEELLVIVDRLQQYVDAFTLLKEHSTYSE